MSDAGGQRSVAQGRVDISETIRVPLVEIVERNLGRKVVGFMSSSHQDPDLLSLTFVLDSSPVIHGGEGSPPPDLHAV